MSGPGLFDKTSIPHLEKVLDLSSVRQRAYASNIANVDTPAYRRLDVRFAEELSRSTRLRPTTTHPAHAQSARATAAPGINVAPDAESEPGIDLDREMVAIAENQLRFNLAARLSALRIAGLRASIHGRR